MATLSIMYIFKFVLSSFMFLSTTSCCLQWKNAKTFINTNQIQCDLGPAFLLIYVFRTRRHNFSRFEMKIESCYNSQRWENSGIELFKVQAGERQATFFESFKQKKGKGLGLILLRWRIVCENCVICLQAISKGLRCTRNGIHCYLYSESRYWIMTKNVLEIWNK